MLLLADNMPCGAHFRADRGLAATNVADRGAVPGAPWSAVPRDVSIAGSTLSLPNPIRDNLG